MTAAIPAAFGCIAAFLVVAVGGPIANRIFARRGNR